jgi:prepilin-type N-terminal cleavage/methylation domain-containing protein
LLPTLGMELRKASSQRGLTLIELLVVIGIIAILASVALTEFATYKRQAVDTDMLSALHAARHAMEAFYVVPESYAGATEADLPTYGYRASSAISIKIVSKTVANYSIRVCAGGGTSQAFLYDTTLGISQPDSGSCS